MKLFTSSRTFRRRKFVFHRQRSRASQPTATTTQTQSAKSQVSIAARIVRGFVLPLMLAVVLFAGLVYFIFPTTTWLDQRAEAAEVQGDLDQLIEEQTALRNEIARMRTSDEVERIARRDFNYVFPGEESYAVLPSPPDPVSLPSSWPFNVLYAEVLD